MSSPRGPRLTGVGSELQGWEFGGRAQDHCTWGPRWAGTGPEPGAAPLSGTCPSEPGGRPQGHPGQTTTPSRARRARRPDPHDPARVPRAAHPALAGQVQAAALGLDVEGGAHRGPAGADPPAPEPGPEAAQPPGAQHCAAAAAPRREGPRNRTPVPSPQLRRRARRVSTAAPASHVTPRFREGQEAAGPAHIGVPRARASPAAFPGRRV